MAKMGELERAARRMLGVTSSTLRQRGWSTASPARVQAVRDDRPDWLIAARENRGGRRAKDKASRRSEHREPPGYRGWCCERTSYHARRR